MTKEKLEEFIANGQENPKLDFKKEWYKEQDLKTELLKDIIALTNGNIHTIGERSYLIIGVKEGQEANEIHHVELDKSIDALQKEILQNLQNKATPSIQDLEITKHIIEEKDIYVIEIPFHPYPIILKDKIRQHPKDTLLLRAGEGTISADYATRKAFEEALERYVKESENKQSVTITVHGDVKGVVNAESGSVINQTIS